MYKHSAVCFLILLVFTGCFDKTKHSNQDATPLPEAMQEPKASYSSKRSHEDPVNSIYQNILDKSPELKKIDEETKEVLSKESDSVEVVSDYLNTVNNYYSSAAQHLKNIQDSVLKAKILDILTLNRNNFVSKSKPFTSSLDSINWNTKRVRDRLEILKVLLTLPVIQEYEKNNQPPISPLREFMRDLQNRERVLDSVILEKGG